MRPDGVVAREALSFAPDPDDWRPGASAPRDEVIWGGRYGEPDAELSADPGSELSDRGRTFSGERVSSIPESDMYWQPLPWMRLVGREQRLAREQARAMDDVALMRHALLADIVAQDRSRAPYRQLSKKNKNALAQFARDMERIRRRYRGE